MTAHIEKQEINHYATKQERDIYILQMAKQKKDLQEIAEETHVSLTTVYRVLQMNGVDVKEVTEEAKMAKRAKKQAHKAEEKAQKQEQYVQQIIQMYEEEGLSTRGIATTLQLSEGFVCDVLRKQGINLQNEGKRRIIERDKVILVELKSGKKVKELALQYGLTEQTIRKIHKKGEEDISRREERLKELEVKKQIKKEKTNSDMPKPEEEKTQKEILLERMRTDAVFFADLQYKLEDNAKKGNWKPFIKFTDILVEMREEQKARTLIQMAKQTGNIPTEVQRTIRIWEQTMEKRKIRKYVVPQLQNGNVQKVEAMAENYLQNKEFRIAKEIVEVVLEYMARTNPTRNRFIELHNTIEIEKKQYILEKAEEKQRKQQVKEDVQRILQEKIEEKSLEHEEER